MTPRFAIGLVILGLSFAPFATNAAEKAPDKKEGQMRLERPKEITEDVTISGKIKAAYAKDKAVSALGINVDTDKGVVTLRGNAKSREEAEKAVSIAKSTPGVASVKNEIQVTSSAKK
jgi:osmotically-inducible protein OsmY